MDFKDINEKIDTVDGFFQPLDQYIWDWILTLQNEENLFGHLVEFGVYKGKSLCKLAQHQKVGEHILGVDCSLSLEGMKTSVMNAVKKTSNISLNCVNLLDCMTEYLYTTRYTSEGGATTEFRNKARFLHIDAGHSGYNVYEDLKLADKYLSPNGILVMDDWSTRFYPDLVDAFYRYIIANPNSFKILMISECKMYACRPKEYSNYIWRMETKMIPFMKEHYNKPIKIFKTKNYVDSAKLVIMHESEYSKVDPQDNAIDVLV